MLKRLTLIFLILLISIPLAACTEDQSSNLDEIVNDVLEEYSEEDLKSIGLDKEKVSELIAEYESDKAKEIINDLIKKAEENKIKEEEIEEIEDKENKEYTVPNVEGELVENEDSWKIILQWDKIDLEYLKGYKIVASVNNPEPRYPEDGYIFFIEDKEKTSVEINSDTKCHNTDFGTYLEDGQAYYVSVTAIYEDKNIKGNSIKIIIPKVEEKEEIKEIKYIEPKVEGEVRQWETSWDVLLEWNKIDLSNLKGYKVVVSKNNPNPKYPEDGYVYWITDKNKTRVEIGKNTKCNNTDFGSYLKSGESYYFSITAVYNDRKVRGNAIKLTIPEFEEVEKEYKVPSVEGEVRQWENSWDVLLEWNKIDLSHLKGYKVVISKNNPNPKYPEDGYVYWITDKNKTIVEIDKNTKCNNTDFGSYLKPGESYYFSVTAVYNDKKVNGNAIKLTIPEFEEVEKEYIEPRVEGEVRQWENSWDVLLEWNPINLDHFKYYKVVVSKNNPNPKYPEDGYIYCIEDKNKTRVEIWNESKCNNSDFGSYLKPGESYYFSITAVYEDKKVSGNAIKLTIPVIEEEKEVVKEYVEPVVDGLVRHWENSWDILLEWELIELEHLLGYKVVVSKNNSTPMYPEDGYVYWITDKNKTIVEIDKNTKCNNTDFGSFLQPGNSYYFSVTAVYDDKKVRGNAIKLILPGE